MLRAHTALRRFSSIPSRAWHVAVVGSGPAAFYATDHLLKNDADVHVHIFEQLPVPFGLVRFGVAPDHQDVKNVTERFEQIERESGGRCTFSGNVHVGAPDAARPEQASLRLEELQARAAWHQHLPTSTCLVRQTALVRSRPCGHVPTPRLARWLRRSLWIRGEKGCGVALAPCDRHRCHHLSDHPTYLPTHQEHYSAVVLAYGAAAHRGLGVPGEELHGVHAARQLVEWYNGHPKTLTLTLTLSPDPNPNPDPGPDPDTHLHPHPHQVQRPPARH